MTLYAGLDWASAEHAVCVIDERGQVLHELSVPHSAKGLSGLVGTLRRIGRGQAIAVAIERPSGLLVDTLVSAGQPVVPIHPNVVKASRPRYRSSGAKSDPGDAYLLADLLRTDGHRFRALEPLSDEVRALRSRSRTRDALVRTRVRLTNQLRTQLEAFWPGPIGVFSELDSPISLAFIAAFPAPTDARKLDERRMQRFLSVKRYSGHRTAAALLERLRAAPDGLVGEVEEAARRDEVLALVAVLQPLVAQIGKLTASTEDDIENLADGRIVMSLPGTGRVNAAQILSELGDDRSRFIDAEHLAAEAGVAPVTRASGKHRATLCRFGCNKRLRWAITTWADNSRRRSEWAAGIYARARARGCKHSHAIRILARAWCRVLWRCWHERIEYDPARHAAAVAMAA